MLNSESVPQYTPETVEAFKKLYSDKKDTIEYLEKFGNRFEKAQALLIKEIAAMSNVQNTRESLVDEHRYFGSSSSHLRGEN